MWKSLKQHFSKKRTQQEAASSSLTGEDDTGDLVVPSSDEEYNSRPKRRSVSIDTGAPRLELRTGDKRTSLEQWHEARRARNSMEGQGTTTTGRLTVYKAGSTTIVNKTYITIKHLGSGTFGRVMLCYNVYDQRLYAIKMCRKSQFAQFSNGVSRYSHGSRLRRCGQTSSSHNNLQSPGSSTCLLGPRSSSCGLPASSACNNSGPVGPVSCGGSTGARVTNITATSATADINAAAVAAAAAAAAAANAAAACAVLGSGASNTAFGMGIRPAGCWGASAMQQGAAWGSQGQLLPPIQAQQEQLFALGSQEQQQSQLQKQQPQVKVSPPPRLSPVAALDTLQRGPMRGFGCGPSSCGGAAAIHVNTLTSSSSTGWGGPGGMMGTDGSTGSLSNGSVFQEALLRFQTEEMVKEIAILKKLNHPNIVKLVEVIDDPNIDSLLLVMEYVEGGTLEPRQLGPARWEPLSEKDVWRYVREVLQGLDYLHHHRVVHGDLKPANLLLDSNSGKVKIADFGSSIMAGSDKLFSMRSSPGFSTPAFRSPESLTSGYTPSYEMDLWALGVCIYMWVYGCLPFSGAAPFIIYERIRAHDIMQPAAPDLSPELHDFIAQLLEKDVMRRVDVLGAMQHPWVTLGGSAPLPSCRQDDVACCLKSSSRLPNGFEVSQQDIDAAIRQIGSSMSEMMDVAFEEMHLKQGQEVISAGEVADRIYLIAGGEVEIIQGIAGLNVGHEPLISGVEVELADPQDTDMWDSTQVSDLSKSPGTSSMMLLSDALSPWDGSSLPAGSSANTHSYKVLGVKGPGDSLGVPVVPGGSSNRSGELRWKVSVRARSDVTLFRARLCDLERLVEAHPEMESAVKQIVTQQETDMMVAEAMRQLQLYNHVHVPGVVMAKS